MTLSIEEREALEAQVTHLEQQLEAAKGKLNSSSLPPVLNGLTHDSSSLHTLLLLADSALPLGSFAFSSGLESFLAHDRLKGRQSQAQGGLLRTFLDLSLQSLASTALPYMFAAYRDPTQLEELDNDFDASTPCTVARRASVAQGRALLSVWERSFSLQFHEQSPSTAAIQLKDFSSALRATKSNAPLLNAHLAPLWGVISLLMSIELHTSAYLFLFSHARTVISAAVRASVLGPYQAQAVLASIDLKQQIDVLVRKCWNRGTGDAGQAVPVMDLWVGRHEKLYSRIFNS